ncbi:hypothetical protein LTR85_011257 [Meristemomyces frigidus]|nr:hypothetical protein LTR85_011257 [Meristemomyces frigidus]
MTATTRSKAKAPGRLPKTPASPIKRNTGKPMGISTKKSNTAARKDIDIKALKAEAGAFHKQLKSFHGQFRESMLARPGQSVSACKTVLEGLRKAMDGLASLRKIPLWQKPKPKEKPEEKGDELPLDFDWESLVEY